MDYVERKDIFENRLPGRTVQNAVGHNSAVLSEKMTVSFCRYDETTGIMEPHNHAEETVVVIGAEKSYVLWGPDKDNLCYRQDLKFGDVMHFPNLEWHVFRFDEGGYLDAICIYGQVTGIRPEEMECHA